MMQERRKSLRRRTYLGGKIVFNHRSSVVDCLVRNFSPTGAKLVLSEAVAVPQVFDMKISTRDYALRARTVWRHEGAMGVVFIEPPRSANVVQLDQARRVREPAPDFV
jgi:hypothetical protein